MNRSLRGQVAVVGVGETMYYKAGQSPDAEFKLALKAILAACEELEIASAKGKENRLLDGFRALEVKLRNHRQHEDDLVVAYIEKRHAHDKEVLAEIHALRKQRDKLRRQVNGFFDKYDVARLDQKLMGDLPFDLNRLGETLIGLIEKEETELYSFYK